MAARNLDTDDFTDVEIGVDKVGDLTSNHQYPPHSSLGYLYKKTRSVQHVSSTDSFARSTQSLINNNSHDNIPDQTKFKRQIDKPPPVPKKDDKFRLEKPSYSPSKKLKNHRKIKREDLENISNYDNSEDELDSSVIIFDVPLSQSLQQLTKHEKPVQPKLLSFDSATTRNSSVMSYDHATSDVDSDIDFSMLSTEAKRLTFEFTQSKSIRAVQESEIRRHIISHFERPKSLDGDLPNSKLKEKLITTTRPSYLPPKNKHEAVKHLRELKDLKAKALKDEIELEKEKLKALKKRQILNEMDLKTWEKEILPDFKTKIQLSSTRELWWRGIPSKLRKSVWTRQIECKSIDSNTLRSLKIRASESIKKNTKTIESIESDISKVFPDLGVFQTSLFEELKFLLAIYSHYTTYEKSISGIAAVLLYYIQDTDRAFLALVGLLQRPLLKSIYSGNHSRLDEETQSFLRTFAKKNPSLYSHFHTVIKINPETYIIPLLKSLFTNVLSMEAVSLIMDVYIFEGDSVLWRVILGLFEIIGYKLYGNEKEIMDVLGDDALMKLNGTNEDCWYKYLDVGDEVEFLGVVRQVLKKEQTPN